MRTLHIFRHHYHFTTAFNGVKSLLDKTSNSKFGEEDRFVASGNYQTLINQALRQHIERQEEPLEEVLRRVVREELDRAA
jgi:hypothetical protein